MMKGIFGREKEKANLCDGGRRGNEL